jgi:predicted esterase
MLHGAGGSSEGGLNPFLPLADDAGLVLLAPDSRQVTWDVVVTGRFGRDAAFIDMSLAQTFARCAVDPSRIAIAGFSDGATYSLSLGLTNGDLFKAIVAFSPGFEAAAEQHGKPRIFISHGTRDTTLPIAQTSRRIVPRLRGQGYRVRFRVFRGPHTVPPEVAREAVAWLTATAAGA